MTYSLASHPTPCVLVSVKTGTTTDVQSSVAVTVGGFGIVASHSKVISEGTPANVGEPASL